MNDSLTLEVSDAPFLPQPVFAALVTSNDKSTRQPSLFWKAFGYTLQKIFQMPGNMVDDRQALFIAALDQPGIPIGAKYMQEVTNYQLYVKADKVQVVNHPTYSLDRLSYHEMIYEWLRYSSEADGTPELDQLQREPSAAQSNKELEWKRAFVEYGQRQDKQQSLVDFIITDSGYAQAWKEEERLKNVYRNHLTEGMRLVGEQLEITKATNDRAIPRKYANMPCINISDNDSQSTADPKDIYFRPLYELEDYNSRYQSWLNGAWQRPAIWDGPHPISMAGARMRDWASLGHPGLDSLPTQLGRDDIDALLDKTKITISYQGGRPAWFDVSRGLWDMTTILGRTQLPAEAPSYMRERFCKTTKLIMAYGCRIDVVLPAGIAEESIEILLDVLPLPLQEVPSAPGKYTYTRTSNYPSLLGVVASLV